VMTPSFASTVASLQPELTYPNEIDRQLKRRLRF